MATHYFLTAGLVALLGAAAYEVEGFQNSESLLRSADEISSDLADSLEHHTGFATDSFDNLLNSSTQTAELYGEFLFNGIDREFSDISFHVEDQLKLIAQTVQGPATARRRSSAFGNSRSQQCSSKEPN